MSVTETPFTRATEEEWRVRVDLAACYRLVDLFAGELNNLSTEVRIRPQRPETIPQHCGAVIAVSESARRFLEWPLKTLSFLGDRTDSFLVFKRNIPGWRLTAPKTSPIDAGAQPFPPLTGCRPAQGRARSTDHFDSIQMSLIDTWAATGAGAFSLSENGLYTLEGWRTFFNHLTPSGTFTVFRWYAPDNVNETGRMLSLAMATLMDKHVPNPREHVFLAAAEHLATLIVAKGFGCRPVVTVRARWGPASETLHHCGHSTSTLSFSN
jgi:hypothetical protein